ncbi:MAG: hypothetical protein NTZ55_04060 [Candidatus Roizmanbacteria bacterium]|nr:hypothetical protein [Candidatus Roizmanbacteria bacterium]
MAERSVEQKLAAIESSVGNLTQSSAWGGCKTDVKNVIAHLTQIDKLCKTGTPIHMVGSDFDAPGDFLTIFSLQANGLTQVGYHEVALMDDQLIVDLGRAKGNRVFLESEYYSMIERLQR